MDCDDMATAAHEAATRIAGIARETPLDHSAAWSQRTGAHVWFKLENMQFTGSFKLRGAVNRLLTLEPALRSNGCVAASSGNHGAALAFAMQKLGVDGVIFVPEHTASTKVDAIRACGGDVRFFGTDGLDTELHARNYARDNEMFYVSPYNDEQVIAGQGSCGVEILRQLPDVDAVFVAVGGGGLISGVGSVLKAHDATISVIGCQPVNSPVMTRSIEAGHIVDMPSEPTLSDGTAGGIEADSITFPLCQAVVDDYLLVSEAEIAAAMRAYMDTERQLIEGAAGVAIAGFEQKAAEFVGKNVVILICGANISRATLQTVIS